MTKEEALKVWHDSVGFNEIECSDELREAISTAFKALKQEPCEDAIRRQAVLDTLDNMDKALDVDRTVENYKQLLKECYKELPPVQPKAKTGWIPVSKRLPELGQRVLCYCRAKIYDVLKYTRGGWFEDAEHCYMDGFVLAWMPLPEPYKAESEE